MASMSTFYVQLGVAAAKETRKKFHAIYKLCFRPLLKNCIQSGSKSLFFWITPHYRLYSISHLSGSKNIYPIPYNNIMQ